MGGSVSFNVFAHDDHEIGSSLVSSLLNEVLYGLIDKNYFEANSWKRGKLTKEEIYKKSGSSYVLLKSVEHTFETTDTDTIFNNYVYSPWETPYTDWTVPDPYSSGVPADFSSLQYCYYQGETILGKKTLEQTVVKDYDENGTNPVTTTTDYYYDNDTHRQLTRTHTTDSKGECIISITRFPDDVVSTSTLTGGDITPAELTEIEKMQWDGTDSQIGKPIQKEVYRDYDDDEVADANELLSVQRTKYYDWGTSNVQPESISSLRGAVSPSNQLEDRLVFHEYDNNGNPGQIEKPDGIHESYIWGYNGSKLIAKTVNAKESEIFHTSFEEDGTSSSTAATGNFIKSLSSAYSISKTIDVGSYLLTYQWRSNSSSPWELQLESKTHSSGSVSTSKTSGQIDELRLYPEDAQMITYTHDPLIGVTSVTDPNNQSMHYKYDDFGRMIEVRDSDGILIQEVEYNYVNQ
jgi:YD repeat-containing protein